MTSEQEIFDHVMLTLVKQGGPSIDVKKNKCVYHREDGRACPGGMFIDKRLDNTDLSNTPFNYLAYRVQEAKIKALSDRAVGLVNKLQEAHDETARWSAESARSRFILVAKEFRLDHSYANMIHVWKP